MSQTNWNLDHNQNILNNNFSNNIVFNTTVADDSSKILAWISPLEPRIRHENLQDLRVKNVGEWFLRTEQFQSWSRGARQDESTKAALFCSGNPGVGKTYISSLVIDTLGNQAREQNTSVACFYFDFAVQEEQAPRNILAALLKQVVKGLDPIPDELVQAYKGQRSVAGGRRLQLPEIVEILQIITSSRRTFICIDALDEYLPNHRPKLLRSLKEILQTSPHTRLFLTGRPNIQDEIEEQLSGRVTVVSISPRNDDIIRYIHARLEEDPTPREMNSELKEDIVKRISEIGSDIFLLVSLNVQAILRETSIHRRQQRLSAMIDVANLEDVYGAMLGRINAQGGERSRIAMDTLMWISHSQRPLQVDELCHALAIERGTPGFIAKNVRSIETLLSFCQGLIAVDSSTSTVRLIHATLQEYLSTNPGIFVRAHSTIAEACLTYLNSDKFQENPANPIPNPQDIPFLKYSSRYWGIHAKKDLSSNGKSLALELLVKNDHIFATSLVAQLRDYGNLGFGSRFTGLHCAAFFGIVEIASPLIEMKVFDLNQRDFGGVTPLIWAAENGHEEMVELLLNQEDVNPDKPDGQARTPLSRAAQNGNDGVVRLLLKMKNVNPNKVDRWGRTPLSRAASNGHKGVVELLLERDDINPNKPDRIQDKTPLSRAAGNGHMEVVKLLLGRNEVNPDKPDKVYGRSALWWASGRGHEEVVKLLIEQKGVDPDKPDKWGRTALSQAARKGHGGVVKLLLEQKGVDPGKPDKWGRTPLLWAAKKGHDAVVTLILECGGIDPNMHDNRGQTPLSWAAENGQVGVVTLLLGCEDVDSQRPDNDGKTPLSWAYENGHDRVVKLLQSRVISTQIK